MESPFSNKKLTFQDFEKGLLADLFPSSTVVQPTEKLLDDLDLVIIKQSVTVTHGFRDLLGSYTPVSVPYSLFTLTNIILLQNDQHHTTFKYSI